MKQKALVTQGKTKMDKMMGRRDLPCIRRLYKGRSICKKSEVGLGEFLSVAQSDFENIWRFTAAENKVMELSE
jgi:hypothetical protein